MFPLLTKYNTDFSGCSWSLFLSWKTSIATWFLRASINELLTASGVFRGGRFDAPLHGRWNRGSRGSSCSPNFWHGRAGHSSCSPKSLSLLHCAVRLSRIDLDILEFCRSMGRSRTKKLSASRGLRPPDPPPRALPLDPAGGSAPRPPL